MILFICMREREKIEESLDYLKNWGWENIYLKDCLYKRRGIRGEELARIRVVNPEDPLPNPSILPGEVRFEEKRIEDCACGKGNVYCGYRLTRFLAYSLDPQERRLSSMPVFITPDYVATWDSSDLRWHLRYAIFSIPTLVSLRGIVEAPARPREFYISRRMGVDTRRLEEKMKDDFLTHEDRRLSRVLAGIILQAIFYFRIGNPFCEDRECSLFHAHWQRELLSSQDDNPYTLCPYHRNLWQEFLHKEGGIRYAKNLS